MPKDHISCARVDAISIIQICIYDNVVISIAVDVPGTTNALTSSIAGHLAINSKAVPGRRAVEVHVRQAACLAKHHIGLTRSRGALTWVLRAGLWPAYD